MEAAEVIREIMLLRYLESHPPDQEIDLRHLRDAELFSPHFHCYQVKNRWLLAFRRYRLYDDWVRKAKRIVHEARQPDTALLVEKVASALDPRQDTRPFLSRILHVAVDMSLPIGEQLERIKSRLTEIRGYLYRFTTQPPPRDRMEFVWRDTYVFLLSRMKERSVAEIGKEVFGSEHKASREMKVRQILHKVGLAVKRAAIILPQVRVKTDPPAKLNTPS